MKQIIILSGSITNIKINCYFKLFQIRLEFYILQCNNLLRLK